MTITELAPSQRDDALTLAGKLSDWFDKQGLVDMAVDMRHQPGLAAVIEGRLVGFLTWFVTQGCVCIGWVAVEPTQHRQGVGRALVNRLIQDARQQHLKRIRVWTLSQSVDYAPYIATRAFYRAMGFVPWKRLPGYCGDGSEMEIYQLELDG